MTIQRTMPLRKRLKRTQYTQKVLRWLLLCSGIPTFIPTLVRGLKRGNDRTSNDPKVKEQTTKLSTHQKPTAHRLRKRQHRQTALLRSEETSKRLEEPTEVVIEGSETATTESTTVASDEVLEADEVPSALRI